MSTLRAQSPPEGMLVLDDTGLPSKGLVWSEWPASMRAPWAQVANCQIVVSTHEACSPLGRHSCGDLRQP